MNKNLYDRLGYYKILEIEPSASEEVIRQKYRDLAKFWHPDYNNDSQAISMFQKISVAYEILKDPQKRLKYTLLSMIYNENNFPNMSALTLINNVHGQEDLNLRAFHLIEVTGKGFSFKKIDKTYYCSQYEAAGVVKNITKHNWIYGFLGVLAVPYNLKAIFQNILNINSKKDNLLVLLHNSIVYQERGEKDKALTLAMLALGYANPDEKRYILDYQKQLENSTAIPVKKWNFNKYRWIQLFYPLIICLAALLLCGFLTFKNNQNIQIHSSVKKTVVFADGKKTYSDVSVAKIFDIPVDVYDINHLYHVTQQTNAMHGADYSFAVYKPVDIGSTVRVTGYSVDKKWYRVMFDNGEMAFIEANKLEKGIGNPIPLWSKIYKEN